MHYLVGTWYWQRGSAMTESSLTVRVEDDLKSAFLDEARKADRTGGQLIRDFMRDYIRQQREAAEYDAFVRHKVEVGLKQARAGRVVSHENAEREFAPRRAAARRPPREK